MKNSTNCELCRYQDRQSQLCVLHPFEAAHWRGRLSQRARLVGVAEWGIKDSPLRYVSLNFEVDPSGSVRRFRMVDDFLAPHMPFCICKAQTIFELEQRPLKKQTHLCHFSPFLPMSLCLVCCEAVQYDVQRIILYFLPVCTNIYIYNYIYIVILK